jgi:hypothetical protein
MELLQASIQYINMHNLSGTAWSSWVSGILYKFVGSCGNLIRNNLSNKPFAAQWQWVYHIKPREIPQGSPSKSYEKSP